MSEKDEIPASELVDLNKALLELLRIKSHPFALKLIPREEDLNDILGICRPQEGVRFSTCQLIGQVRHAGVTLGFTHKNVIPNSNCGGVLGLNAPSDFFRSGKAMNSIWFGNLEAACQHQTQMPRAPLAGHDAVAVSPLRSGRLDNPDIVLFYATPGQMILFINGLQYNNYVRCDFSITGESACADSWGRALLVREPSLSLPCYAERRFGGVADDELLMALPPEHFASAIQGLKELSSNGIRYPIPPYGSHVDPMPTLIASYGEELDQDTK